MQSLSPTYEDLDLELRLQLDKVIRAFERAFLANPATRLEVFLVSAADRREYAVLLLELLRVELECRREQGQVPKVEEYLLRLPDDTDTIRAAFRASADSLSGTRLRQYQLTQVIGRGGIGVVYAAIDTVVNRQVAVKILSGSLSTQARAHEYLLREAQLVGQLLHPNIVTLFEAGEVDGVCFLVLEYVSGGSAATAVRQNGPFDWGLASRIILDVCQGLAAAHAIGLIHRDIKPANILLLESESASSASGMVRPPLAKLTDFGLARAVQDEACAGTPQYMAPEQFAHGISNPTTDIYSLGATYLALLTGSPPFEAPTLLELQEAHRTAPIPDVRKINPTVPEGCARIIRRCLAKSADERYPTVDLLIEDLNYLLSLAVSRRVRRRRSVVLALAGAAALGTVAGFAAIRTGTPTAGPKGLAASALTEAGPWRPLLNGRKFSGWKIRDRYGAMIRNKGNFTVKVIDDEPTVMSGSGGPYYLVTDQDHENYHLSLEYRWLPRIPSSTDNGVIYHCYSFGRQEVQGYKFALGPPCSGQYSHLDLKPPGLEGPNQARTSISLGAPYRGQIMPRFDKPADTAVNRDRENAPGEWNRLDLVCFGDSALHVVNSRVVRTLTRSRLVVGNKGIPLTRGQIMLQSGGAAIAYRRIKIRSIDGIPPEFLSANGE